jgi:hypothetical protein
MSGLKSMNLPHVSWRSGFGVLTLRLNSLAAVLALMLGGAGGLRAQSSAWDSTFSNTQWYVPAENLLAYLASGTDLSSNLPVADQTIWQLGVVQNGVFTGNSSATFKLGNATITSNNTMNGIVTESGQVRILFSSDGQPTTVGIGQIRTINNIDFFEMQMISGSSTYLTHWAYMAPYDGNSGNLPPLEISPSQLTSSEWNWMEDTSWNFQNDELFGVGGVGTFQVTDYVNGYFWGTGSGPAGSPAETFSLLGSATPEGNVLFNMLSNSTLTSLTGLVTGNSTTGSMFLRSYSANGTIGDPGLASVVPEPSAVALLAAAFAGWAIFRSRKREGRST